MIELIHCVFWAGRFDGSFGDLEDLPEHNFPVPEAGGSAVVKHVYKRERTGFYVFDREEIVHG